MGRPCSCGVELRWARSTVTSSKIPFRTTPQQGLFTLRPDPENANLTIAVPLPQYVYLNHFVDCPDRAKHRKAR